MLNVIAWIATAPLALMFAVAGVTKLATSRQKLLKQPRMGWAEDFSATAIKAIAASEVLGALGLTLPWLLRVAPVLTPLAALGSVVLMTGAVVVHIRRNETKAAPMPAVLAGLGAIVAILRMLQLLH